MSRDNVTLFKKLLGPMDVQQVKRIELEVQKFYQCQRYDRNFAIDCNVSWFMSMEGDIERRLAHYVYGRSHTAEYSHPADWWQTVKARWFPKRWLKRWPVRLKTVRFDAKALVPELQVMANRHIIAYFGELRE